MIEICLTNREWYWLMVQLDRIIKEFPNNHMAKGILEELNNNKPLTNNSYDFNMEYECEWIGNNDVPIEDLNFSVAVYNYLKRAGINFKSDIERLSEDDILKIRGISKARLNEIKKGVNMDKKHKGSGNIIFG